MALEFKVNDLGDDLYLVVLDENLMFREDIINWLLLHECYEPYNSNAFVMTNPGILTMFILEWS